MVVFQALSFLIPSEQIILGSRRFEVVLLNRETVLLVQAEDDSYQFFIADPGAELAVQQVAGGFGEWGFINFVNGQVQRLDVEQAVLYVGGVVLEPLIDTAASESRNSSKAERLPIS